MKNVKTTRSMVVLAAVLIVNVLFVPIVSARDAYEGETAYFTSLQSYGEEDAVHFTNLPPARNYELVTADSALFMADVSSGKSIVVDLLGKEYLLDLTSVPAPVAEDAKYIVVNESGTFITDPPLINSYVGTVSGDPESYVFFTVDNEVILGTVRTRDASYVIEQVGVIEIGGKRRIVHAIYDDYSVIDIKEPLDYCGLVPLERVTSETTEQLPDGTRGVVSAAPLRTGTSGFGEFVEMVCSLRDALSGCRFSSLLSRSR